MEWLELIMRKALKNNFTVKAECRMFESDRSQTGRGRTYWTGIGNRKGEWVNNTSKNTGLAKGSTSRRGDSETMMPMVTTLSVTAKLRDDRF